MKPATLTGHRRYEVVWHKNENDNRFSLSAKSFDNGLKYGWITANSPHEAWRKAKGKDKRYGIRNPQTKEYYYPPRLVNEIAEMKKRAEEIPF